MADKYHSTKFYVYVHRRATDKRVFYVGKGYAKRAWSKTGRNKYWNNVANKHGYIIEIVFSNLTELQAFDMEREFISHYGRENLCNLTDGGEGSSGWIPSDEFKRNVSITQTGRKRSEETKNKLKKIAKNRSKETINKISESLKGKPQPWHSGDNNAMRNPEVLEMRSGVNHHFFGKKRPDMSGKNHHFFGVRRLDMEGENHPNAVSVVCIETNVKFNAIEDAVRWLKDNGYKKAIGSNISMCCKGTRKRTYGYHWKYADK